MDQSISFFFQTFIFVALICIAYVIGSLRESAHYRSITLRETKFLPLPAVTMKDVLEPDDVVEDVRLVFGCAVISLDYFKRFLAGLRNIFGGEVKSYETLIDRARREAILRMKEMAAGADIIINMRIETAAIGESADKRKSVGSIEAIVYGTALKLGKKS